MIQLKTIADIVNFQRSHGLKPDGILGPLTQAELNKVNSMTGDLPITNAWPRDTTADKNDFYGNFQWSGWQEQYLVHMTTPFTMYYSKQPMYHGILVNKKIVSALTVIFQEIWDKCDHDQKKVNETGASDFGGAFNIRRIAGSDNWSNHSWACALDLSPGTNGFNAKTTLSNIVIDAFKRQGARWGGDYHGRKDPMHFEFVRPV